MRLDNDQTILVRMVALVSRIGSRLFANIRIEGLERIPRTGAVILAANHISNARSGGGGRLGHAGPAAAPDPLAGQAGAVRLARLRLARGTRRRPPGRSRHRRRGGLPPGHPDPRGRVRPVHLPRGHAQPDGRAPGGQGRPGDAGPAHGCRDRPDRRQQQRRRLARRAASCPSPFPRRTITVRIGEPFTTRVAGAAGTRNGARPRRSRRPRSWAGSPPSSSPGTAARTRCRPGGRPSRTRSGASARRRKPPTYANIGGHGYRPAKSESRTAPGSAMASAKPSTRPRSRRRRARPRIPSGQVVHNEGVIRDLQQLGIESVDTLDDVDHGAAVVIRAHGVKPEVFERAEERGLDVIDGTCTWVIQEQRQLPGARGRGLHHRAARHARSTRRSSACSASPPTPSSWTRRRTGTSIPRRKRMALITPVDAAALEVREAGGLHGLARPRAQDRQHRLPGHDPPPAGHDGDWPRAST